MRTFVRQLTRNSKLQLSGQVVAFLPPADLQHAYEQATEDNRWQQLDCCRQEIAPLVSKSFAELAEGSSPAWERCQVNLKDRKAHSNPYLPTPITRWINVLAWWVDSMPAWLPGRQHST